MDRFTIYALLFVACCLWGVAKWFGGRSVTQPSQTASVVEKPWEYPEPAPNRTFHLEKTECPRYRAFGTINVKKLSPDDWVILDNDWPLYHRIKVQRLADRGDKIVQTLPPAKAAAHELCQDLGEFLSRRYPQVYTIERSENDTLGWYRMGAILKIEMPALDASYDLTKEDPLTVAGLIQPADINILLPVNDQYYRLSAMMLGIGGGQRIKDKLGKNLADLHFDGQVPHYAEELQRPLDRFLSKLKVDSPIQRNTTAISIHDEYHWPEFTMGPEDDWDPTIRGPGVGTSSYGKWKPPGPVSDISEIWFRQERQVLRRLPKSGAVVWMVHTYIEPMAEVAQEPGIPGKLASHIRSWEHELAGHKGRHLYEHVLLPYLDELHAKQVEGGFYDDGQSPIQHP
ncbi:hypothetical protein VM1G_05853 [Cytospora mali]|uniref:DUF3445 domain-containing protein n=1 Tax=Cytospora mali TaxID=578113 RepID=A0A194W1Y1_CYTMA|nr:hypothetical protein VM1G_05853 [Valsa mali]